MARFICRNYGPSRQVPYKGKSICLSNDQVVETDDAAEAAALGAEKQITVTDRGEEFAAPVPPEKPKTKKSDKKDERKVTVDDAEAVHAEKFPDADEQEKPKQSPPPEAKADTDEIAYADMTVKELVVLAKDRQIKTSGVKKAKLLEALIAYDAEGQFVCLNLLNKVIGT